MKPVTAHELIQQVSRNIRISYHVSRVIQKVRESNIK